MFKLLVWNICGAREVASCRHLKIFVRLHSISFVVIIEPRANVNNLELLKYLGFFDFIFSPTNKIWILWKSGIHAMSLSSIELFCHLYISHDAFIASF